MNTNQPKPEQPGHIPVMLDQVLELLNPKPGDIVLDCTTGRGGHCRHILNKIGPTGRYIGLDMDQANLDFVQQTLGQSTTPLDLIHSNFAQARQAITGIGIEKVDVLLADLGFSSNQMDDPQRGMSFGEDGPLDMRLNLSEATTAEVLLAQLPEKELADLIYEYGEERFSRTIARKIVEVRRTEPIKTTRQLADLCASVYASRTNKSKGKSRRRPTRWRIHPATRTFMALRIAVNRELENLDALLTQIEPILAQGGRAAIISFHSLEDRRVKYAFRELASSCDATILTKKPQVPSDMEMQTNTRSRSAKLRAICLD